MTTAKQLIAPFAHVLGIREAKVDGLYPAAYTVEEMELLARWDNEVEKEYNRLVSEESATEWANYEYGTDFLTDSIIDAAKELNK